MQPACCWPRAGPGRSGGRRARAGKRLVPPASGHSACGDRGSRAQRPGAAELTALPSAHSCVKPHPIISATVYMTRKTHQEDLGRTTN